MSSSESTRAQFPVLDLPSVLSRISVESLLILWFALTPFASFFLRYPHEQSVITFDRAIFGLIFLILLNQWRRVSLISRGGRLKVTPFEIAWALLSIVALVSAFAASNSFPYATKMAVDAFCLPLIAFHVARNHFDVRNRAKYLALGAIWLLFSLFCVGAFEFLEGVNIFPYKGSALIREGELRVNGPFASDAAFAIICSLVLLFLFSITRILKLKFDASGRLVYIGALTVGILSALLPLFRSVAVALLISWVIIEIGLSYQKSTNEITKQASFVTSLKSFLRTRAWTRSRLIVFVFIAFTLVAADSLSGSVRFERRLVDPRNAYGRFATWEAAVEITSDSPILGVGLSNYSRSFDNKYNWAGEEQTSVLDARSSNSPHSNPLWILAELGVIGFVLYLTANVQIFLMGYRAFKNAASNEERIAAVSLLALAVAYWIPGLTLSSGYYSDLNLYFFFMLGILSNKPLALSRPDSAMSS